MAVPYRHVEDFLFKTVTAGIKSALSSRVKKRAEHVLNVIQTFDWPAAYARGARVKMPAPLAKPSPVTRAAAKRVLDVTRVVTPDAVVIPAAQFDRRFPARRATRGYRRSSYRRRRPTYRRRTYKPRYRRRITYRRRRYRRRY